VSLGSLAETRLEARRRGEVTIVVKPGAFIFDNGTIFTHSHHDDCVVKGLRIDTTFHVAGGVRAIAAARAGAGREFGAVSLSAGGSPFNNGPPA
jgi:hypothetical protein